MLRLFIVIAMSSLLWGCNSIEIKKEYYPNGTVKSENRYQNGKLNGECKEFYENGEILSRRHWINGIVDTFDYYYPTGFIRRILYDMNEKIKQDLISITPNSKEFMGFNSHFALAWPIIDKDTLVLGEKCEVEIFFMTPCPDSIKYIHILVGEPSDTINSDSLYYIAERKSVMELKVEKDSIIHATYTTMPTHSGTYELFGVANCILPGEHLIKSYVYGIVYVVKDK